jgi:hypothetical protein
MPLASCVNTPVDTSVKAEGPAPLRMRSPAKESCCYEDNLTGGQIFAMYCNYCHNPPSLAERNFANFRNVAAHMRVRANLTGKEYAKLMEFLRRWNDIPPPSPPPAPSPKLFFFSQPISELRPQTPAQQPAAAPASPPDQPPLPAPRPVGPAAVEQPQRPGDAGPGTLPDWHTGSAPLPNGQDGPR